MFMWAMSDRGIPRSYRMMQGFGVNTFTLTNAQGERSFVKFHFTPTLGVHSLVWDEALKICGQDPDFHRKDLYHAIDKGKFPTWRFGIQVCPANRQDEFDFDILDATKIWPEDSLPIRYIGELQLNKNVDEFFTQTEQVAFCTAHVVPGMFWTLDINSPNVKLGIGFSDDPLLQGRNFSYFDTQLSRLGVNWQEIPVNRPVCPVLNHHRDGQKRHAITKGKFNYFPNREAVIPAANPSQGSYVDYPEKIVAMKQRLHSTKFAEHFNQAQLFYNSLSDIEKAHLTAALSFELDHCDEAVVYNNLVTRLCDIDIDLAKAVAEKVGAPVPIGAGRANHGRKAKGISQAEFTPEAQGLAATISSRTIAIIIADGFNRVDYETMKAILVAAGAFPFTIGPNRQPVVPAGGGNGVVPDHHFEGMRSTLFDSLYIPGGEHVGTLLKQGCVIHWVREAFGHCKPIGATGQAIKLVQAACGVDGMVFCSEKAGDVVESYGVVTAEGVGKKPDSLKEGLKILKGAKDFAGAYAYSISLHRNFKREIDGLTSLVAY